MSASIIVATALVSGVTPALDLPEDEERQGRRARSGHERRDDVVVEAERERQQEPGDDRGEQLRERDLAERPPRRREQVGAGVGQAAVHARQPRAHEQQDEARVEQHVRGDDRRVPEA